MTTPTDWKAEEKRWRNGIDAQTATDEDLTDFILFKLWEYNDCKAMDDGLWSFFQNDFEAFSVDTLSKVHIKHLRNIYTFLRRGGVYVRTKEKRTTYAQLLFEITQEEHQHLWTQENIKEVHNELDGNGFQSNKINNALKYGLNYNILQDPMAITLLFRGTLTGPTDPQTIYP